MTRGARDASRALVVSRCRPRAHRSGRARVVLSIPPRAFALALLVLAPGLLAGTPGSRRPADRPPASAARDTAFTREMVLARLEAVTPGTAADFTEQDLHGLDLGGVDFKQARLIRVDLRGTNLTGANLARVDLFAADLTGAILERADLRGANLDLATLRAANLRQADLTGASLFSVIMENADLREAVLEKARVLGYLKGARLAGARLAGANLGADPGNQSMGVMRTVFQTADLAGADFTGANLYKADFAFASLHGARLVDADLRNAELVETDLRNADLTRARLAKADLNGADFRGAVGLDTVTDLGDTRNRDRAKF